MVSFVTCKRVFDFLWPGHSFLVVGDGEIDCRGEKQIPACWPITNLRPSMSFEARTESYRQPISRLFHCKF